MVFKEWLVELLRIHCGDWFLNPHRHGVRVKMHVETTDRHEVDVVIECGRVMVCIELKKNSLDAVVRQAVHRATRTGCGQVYVALDLPTHSILAWLVSNQELAKAVAQHGIGVVSARDNTVIIRSAKRQSTRQKTQAILELISNIEQEMKT